MRRFKFIFPPNVNIKTTNNWLKPELDMKMKYHETLFKQLQTDTTRTRAWADLV